MNPTFPLTLEFKFSLLTELRVTDAEGQLVALVKEKFFSVRDEVRVYADDGRTQQTHTIRAQGLMAGALDWRARRLIRRLDGTPVGTLQAHHEADASQRDLCMLARTFLGDPAPLGADVPD